VTTSEAGLGLLHSFETNTKPKYKTPSGWPKKRKSINLMAHRWGLPPNCTSENSYLAQMAKNEKPCGVDSGVDMPLPRVQSPARRADLSTGSH
jgi:hypothetical protein